MVRPRKAVKIQLHRSIKAVNRSDGNLMDSALLAERLREYRKRRTAVCQLTSLLGDGDWGSVEEALWNTLFLFEGYPFKTAKGLRYYNA